MFAGATHVGHRIIEGTAPTAIPLARSNNSSLDLRRRECSVPLVPPVAPAAPVVTVPLTGSTVTLVTFIDASTGSSGGRSAR